MEVATSTTVEKDFWETRNFQMRRANNGYYKIKLIVSS